jgi:uncharacterized protein YukE
MAYYGADPGQLRALAAQFSKGAAVLESHAQTLHSMIGSSTNWQGPDAERFRSQWTGRDFKAMSAAITMLRSSAQDLKRNADEQEGVSSESRSSGGGYAADLIGRRDNDGVQDGIRIDKVVGPDGKTRLIVYLEGTKEADRLSEVRNLDAIKGKPDHYLTDKISEALKSTPDGKNTEIMLVGFSQGGMDAQNIAAHSGDYGYKVTNLVTYGSPIIQPDNPNIGTVHMRATGDNVPGLGSGGAATNAAIDIVTRPPGAGTAAALADSVGYVARTADPSDYVFEYNPDIPSKDQWLGNHARDTYLPVANAFDNSTDPRFTEVRDSMKKFDGTVTRTNG